MDWKTRMKIDEAELKEIVDRLEQVQGHGLRTRIERDSAMLSFSRKLVEMRALVDDHLYGRTLHEHSVLEYRMRIEYPLYSHLDSLSAMPREYVDLSCA
jgi:hypothetical protein